MLTKLDAFKINKYNKHFLIFLKAYRKYQSSSKALKCYDTTYPSSKPTTRPEKKGVTPPTANTGDVTTKRRNSPRLECGIRYR